MDTALTQATRFGIIGGNGWIGGALARALVATGMAAAADLTLSCRRTPPDWLPGARWTHDNQRLADDADVIVLSVRPQDWPDLHVAAAGKLIISVMAGISLADIARRTGAVRVVRALPNAAVDVGKSYTPWVASDPASDTDRALVRRLFETCGMQDEVGSEADLDYLTGHSGTGPAYPALLAAAMLEDARAHGLPEHVARRAAEGLLIGAGRLLEQRSEDPAATVQTFLNYEGVTAAAIRAMQAAGFEQAVRAGLAAALGRTLEMKADLAGT